LTNKSGVVILETIYHKGSVQKFIMSQRKPLSASLQDYLEAIFVIIANKGGVRSKDIAHHLGIKAASVTTALQSLAKSKHINYQPYEVISLTSKGIKEAKSIIHKHEALKDFFVQILGAEAKNAEEAACKIEHVIPSDLIERLISLTEFIQACPRCGSYWIDHLHQYFSSEKKLNTKRCRNCIEKIK
jgi:DtxR family Mn-dependent transcriptional regulator